MLPVGGHGRAPPTGGVEPLRGAPVVAIPAIGPRGRRHSPPRCCCPRRCRRCCCCHGCCAAATGAAATAVLAAFGRPVGESRTSGVSSRWSSLWRRRPRRRRRLRPFRSPRPLTTWWPKVAGDGTPPRAATPTIPLRRAWGELAQGARSGPAPGAATRGWPPLPPRAAAGSWRRLHPTRALGTRRRRPSHLRPHRRDLLAEQPRHLAASSRCRVPARPRGRCRRHCRPCHLQRGS